MRKLAVIAVLACSVLGYAQNVRYDQDITSISASSPPFIIANVPPNSPMLSVCNSPANNGAGAACTNYAQTFDSLGNACPNGAQDTPQPQPSACQATADSRGSVGFWAPAGTYDYTVCIQNTCLGPYTVTLGGSGGGGGTLTGITTNTGSGLQGGGTSGTLNMSLINTCGLNQSLLWNGTAWICGNAPSIWSSLTPPTSNLLLNLFSGGLAYTSTFVGGTFPAPGGVVMEVTDNSSSSVDKSYDFDIEVPATSYHHALNVSVDGFQQLQVCSLGGASHLGVVVIGNAVPCSALSISPVAKTTIMDNSPAHVGLRVYQNNVAATADVMQLNTAATAGLTFNFASWCAAAVSGGDTTCASPLGSIRGDGSILAPNFVSSGGVTLNGVTLAGAPSSSGQCPTSTSVSAATWQNCGSGGGGGTGAQHQTAFFSNVNVVGGYGPGTPGQLVDSQGASADPVFATQGVAGGNGGTGVVSANSYAIACDDPTLGVLDRLTTILFTFSGTVSVTLPPPSTSGCGTNFTVVVAASTGTTVNVTSSATFVTLDGSAVGSTVSLTAGQYATINSPNNTSWLVRKVYGIGPNLIISGNLDGRSPTAITTGSSASLGGTFSSGYTYNQEATAATTVTYTLPTAAAGKQYCVSNSYNGSAATTGALTLQTSAAGQFIIWTDGTLSASGGFGLSSGAGGDAACVEGVDSTHWQMYVVRGTWAKH